jgi:hypothetical protein
MGASNLRWLKRLWTRWRRSRNTNGQVVRSPQSGRHRDVDAFDERADRYEHGWLGELHHDIADRTLPLSGPRRRCRNASSISDAEAGTCCAGWRLAIRVPWDFLASTRPRQWLPQPKPGSMTRESRSRSARLKTFRIPTAPSTWSSARRRSTTGQISGAVLPSVAVSWRPAATSCSSTNSPSGSFQRSSSGDASKRARSPARTHFCATRASGRRSGDRCTRSSTRRRHRHHLEALPRATA